MDHSKDISRSWARTLFNVFLAIVISTMLMPAVPQAYAEEGTENGQVEAQQQTDSQDPSSADTADGISSASDAADE
ncbi:MAG: hypothetical protein ACOYIK_03325 [Coriobacteriales bacterium]